MCCWPGQRLQFASCSFSSAVHSCRMMGLLCCPSSGLTWPGKPRLQRHAEGVPWQGISGGWATHTFALSSRLRQPDEDAVLQATACVHHVIGLLVTKRRQQKNTRTFEIARWRKIIWRKTPERSGIATTPYAWAVRSGVMQATHSSTCEHELEAPK